MEPGGGAGGHDGVGLARGHGRPGGASGSWRGPRAAPGERAPGNIATRVLIERVLAKGFETRVNLDRLDRVSTLARELVEQAQENSFGSRGPG